MENLRALLLLEACFNGLHKIDFNSRLMPSLEVSSSVPQEITGCRRLQADTHLALGKKLIADVSNTRKLPTTTTCVDATNGYDRVTHPYASLYSQCFGIDILYLLVLFKTIQSMKMYLRTAFGVSTSFYSRNCQPFQRSIKGNGVALAL